MKEIFCHVNNQNIICGWTGAGAPIPGFISVLVDDNYIPHVGYDKIIDGRLESHESEWQRARDIILHNQPIKSSIIALKQQLADTDYLATKHSEGLISEEDYAPIKAERQGWRNQINELEAQLWTE